jgi:hypothetical protein
MLLKERQIKQEDKEEDISSYSMTLRRNWLLKHVAEGNI